MKRVGMDLPWPFILALALSTLFRSSARADDLPQTFGKPVGEATSVSIFRLLSVDEELEGKTVETIGVLLIEFESDALCATKDDYRFGLLWNCLWIEPDYAALGVDREALARLNGRFVTAIGTYSSKKKGHLGGKSGAITSVTLVELAERENLIREIPPAVNSHSDSPPS